MAIDTAAKRFSMLNFSESSPSMLLFRADGVVDADDRSHLLALYGGIPLSVPVQVAIGRYLTFSQKTRTMSLTEETRAAMLTQKTRNVDLL